VPSATATTVESYSYFIIVFLFFLSQLPLAQNDVDLVFFICRNICSRQFTTKSKIVLTSRQAQQSGNFLPPV
jgi:hypothetical protein